MAFSPSTLRWASSGSGITTGAIYRHFANKTDLLLEVVKRALRALPLSLEESSKENEE